MYSRSQTIDAVSGDTVAYVANGSAFSSRAWPRRGSIEYLYIAPGATPGAKPSQIPELARGQGVTLQRYRDGGLADARTLTFAEGLSWALGGESKRTRTEPDLAPWRAARGSAGRLPPTGFPRSNKFD